MSLVNQSLEDAENAELDTLIDIQLHKQKFIRGLYGSRVFFRNDRVRGKAAGKRYVIAM